MFSGSTVNEIAVKLDEVERNKRDYLADTGAIKIETREGRSRLFLDGDNESLAFGVTHHAHRQIGDRLGIPAKFADRLRNDHPDVFDHAVNALFSRESERRLVRTLGADARAFLSDKYRPLDNYDLASVALPALDKAGATITGELTDRRLYIKALFPDRTAEIGPPEYEWGKGHHAVDVVQAGLVISNSEIGAGALWVQPAILTVKCTNLAIFRKDAMQKYHIGGNNGNDDDGLREFMKDDTRRKIDEAVWSQVRDLVDATVKGEVFNKIVDRLRAARGLKLTGDAPKVIEKVADRFSLTEGERGGVLRHLIAGGDLSAYGVHSAITRAAHDNEVVSDYDRATELERAGGKLIELPANEWGALNN